MNVVSESPLKSFSLSHFNSNPEFPKLEEKKDFNFKNFENQKIKILNIKNKE